MTESGTAGGSVGSADSWLRFPHADEKLIRLRDTFRFSSSSESEGRGMCVAEMSSSIEDSVKLANDARDILAAGGVRPTGCFPVEVSPGPRDERLSGVEAGFPKGEEVRRPVALDERGVGDDGGELACPLPRDAERVTGEVTLPLPGLLLDVVAARTWTGRWAGGDDARDSGGDANPLSRLGDPEELTLGVPLDVVEAPRGAVGDPS